MNTATTTKAYLNEGCPLLWKGRITGVCCPMRVDEVKHLM